MISSSSSSQPSSSSSSSSYCEGLLETIKRLSAKYPEAEGEELEDLCHNIFVQIWTEIEFITKHWTRKNWDCISDPVKSMFNAVQKEATLTNILQLDPLLDELNAQVIRSIIQKSRTELDLSDRCLTRFPKDLVFDPDLKDFWSALKKANFTGNCIPYYETRVFNYHITRKLFNFDVEIHSGESTELPKPASVIPSSHYVISAPIAIPGATGEDLRDRENLKPYSSSSNSSTSSFSPTPPKILMSPLFHSRRKPKASQLLPKTGSVSFAPPSLSRNLLKESTEEQKKPQPE